jgi:hypothetical protein
MLDFLGEIIVWFVIDILRNGFLALLGFIGLHLKFWDKKNRKEILNKQFNGKYKNAGWHYLSGFAIVLISVLFIAFIVALFLKFF